MLLGAAAGRLNALGSAALSVDAVASGAGLSRNAIYYYVRDRSELAWLCFRETCAATLEDLAAAEAADPDPAAQIRRFVEANLATRAGGLAAIADADLLPPPRRADVRTLEAQVAAAIAALVQRGIAAGRFRAVDPAIAARCLMGMIDWVRIAPRWLAEPSGPDALRRLADAVADLLLHGISAGAAPRADLWVPVDALTAVRRNPFDRAEAREEKRQTILAAASRLFNARGIEGASINDIAGELGATKGAFYHYFTDKTDLVVQCYRRAFDLFERFIAEARARGRTGFEQVMLVNHLNCQAQLGASPPLMLQAGLESLPAAVRRDFVERARTVWLHVQQLFEAGVADGSCRPADIQSLTEVAAGSFAFLGKEAAQSTTPPADRATGIARVLSQGILAPARG